MKKDKKGILLKVYPALALASLTVFWLFRRIFTGTPIITFLFVLTALVPGILTGLNLFLIFLAPLAAGAVIFILDVPPVPLSYRDSEPLATLSFYPTVENQLFFELTEPGSRPHLGRLSGKNLALVVKKENYPDYLFFLKSSWVLIGAVTENLNTADLPAESSDTFLLLSEKAVKADPFLQSGYPALRFLDRDTSIHIAI